MCGIVIAKKKFADGPDGFLMGMVIDKLDLNDNQILQVNKIRDEIKTKMESKKSNRENMMEDFSNEFLKDNIDKNKLKELDQKREDEMKSNKDFMMDKLIEFHNLLTPQQRKIAVESMKEMKGKFKNKMEGFKEKNDNKPGREK